MFPMQTVTLETVKANEATTKNTGKTLKFDFETGDFILKDGKVDTLTELEGLKMWISKVLRTTKGAYKIYKDRDYGITNLKELMTKNYPYAFVKAEIEREITETLLKNTNITSLSSFEFTRGEGTKLIVSFTINSVYGNTSESVVI